MGAYIFKVDFMKSLSPTQRAAVSTTLMLAALMWIFIAIWESIGHLPLSIRSLEPWHVGLSVVPAMTMVFISAYTYSLVLYRTTTLQPPVRYVMMPFVASQVVRYLPGKVWGIFYQIQATMGYVSPKSTVRANFKHYILVCLNSLAVAVGVLTYYHYGIIMGLSVFTVSLAAVFLTIRASVLQYSISLIARLRAINTESKRMDAQNNSKDLLILSLMQAEWLFYFMACALILPGYFDIEKVVIVATCYAVAWLAGALTIVIPGGLVVREGAFMWLTAMFGFNISDMLMFSLLARILFTLSEVACAALSLALMNKITRDEQA